MSKAKKLWYAIYVNSRAEKKVAIELNYNGIEYYLPLTKKLKQWSDRKKWVEEPLFRSYIFVHVDQHDFYKVVQTQGVVKYIKFDGNAVVIPDPQIVAIRSFLEENDPENIDESKWSIGRKVEVISGSMTGLLGELIENQGKHKVKVEIEAVGSSLLIQIPKAKLRII